jgi:hypothetical protein
MNRFQVRRPSRRAVAVTAAAAMLGLTPALPATAGGTGAGQARAAETGTPAATRAPATAREPSVVGSGRIRFYLVPDDDIRFHFDARGFFTKARGTFRLSHRTADGFVGRESGVIDCLTVGGRTATLTGIVTHTNIPNGEPVGRRLAFSVEDNGGGGRDRMGFTWGIVDNRVQPPCMAVAPFNRVISGHYAVREAPLPDPPTWFPEPVSGGRR